MVPDNVKSTNTVITFRCHLNSQPFVNIKYFHLPNLAQNSFIIKFYFDVKMLSTQSMRANSAQTPQKRELLGVE